MVEHALEDPLVDEPVDIKQYLRSAYRKIGVEQRTQAALWAVANGFVPDAERTVDPAVR